MSNQTRWKALFYTLLCLVPAVFAILAWLAVSTVNRVKTIEAASNELELKHFRVAAQLRSQLHRLSASMLRYLVTEAPVFRTLFNNYRIQLDRFIEDQVPLLNSPAEQELLQQIRENLVAYFNEAERSMDGRVEEPDREALLARIERTRGILNEIVELAHQLADSRRESFRDLLAEYGRSTSGLQYSVFICISIMISLLIGLTWLAYRTFMTPLETELKRAQSYAAQKEELANIGTLAAGIAHEIRNPLTSMKARVFSLTEFIDKSEPAARQAESIDAELNRLERLVQDFLDYARPSQSFLEEVNLTKFLQEMHRTLTPEVAAQGHAFHLEVSELPTVSIDTQQMRQVVFNLTLNAAEACTGREGKLVLGAKLIQGCPTIFISDNGPGIPDEYRDQLFTPFFSKKSAGTGLGLSIVQSLTRKQGARLYFETETDVGTAFFVELKPL